MAMQSKRLALGTLFMTSVAVAALGCDVQEPDETTTPATARVGETSEALTCLTLARGAVGNIEDAHIVTDATDPSKANSNYGVATLLNTGQVGTGLRRTILRFDLSAIPSNVVVTSAALNLYKSGGVGVGNVDVHRITTAWAESAVTYNTIGGAWDPGVIASFNPAATPNGSAVSIDLTSLANSWVSGALPNEGILLEQASTGRTVFGSSEASALNPRPKLSLCYAPASCNDGLQNGAETGVDCGGPCVACNACVGVVCAALDSCHVAGVCDPATGICSNPTVADGTSCDDGNTCTTSDTCQSGTCSGGGALSCDDGNVCTTDSCDAASGCVSAAIADGTVCGAGDACTPVSTCQAGVCASGGSSAGTFTYTDTTADDITSTALHTFFSGLSVTSSDYIFFEISGSSGSDGAWCASNADFYVNNYVNLAPSNTVLTSGSWNKYHRAEGGAWSAPVTTGYSNYFGAGCDGNTYSWCSEWGLGSRYLATMPGQTSSNGESYASGWSSGAGWVVTIRVGSDFASACDGINSGGGGGSGSVDCDDSDACTDDACDSATGCQNVDNGTCGGGSGQELTYVDGAADDIGSTDLYNFFAGLSVSSSDFILFEISGSSGSDGAWCASNASFYVDNYINLAPGGTVLASGNWNKYHRAEGGAWSAPDTTGYNNYFGTNCDSTAYSWCSEWGLGNRYLATMPGQTSSNGESYASGWSNGAGWTVRIRVGSTRLDACGF